MNLRHTGTRGITLLECLVFVALWVVLSAATMQVIGDARVVRARARDKSLMLMAAQSELDRVRSLPQSMIQAGVVTAKPEQPRDSVMTTRITRREDETWNVLVEVRMDLLEGVQPVSLATVWSDK